MQNRYYKMDLSSKKDIIRWIYHLKRSHIVDAVNTRTQTKVISYLPAKEKKVGHLIHRKLVLSLADYNHCPSPNKFNKPDKVKLGLSFK